jgi:hypothetical protein
MAVGKWNLIIEVAYDNNHTTRNKGTKIFGIQGRFNYISTGLGVIEVAKTAKFQGKNKYVTEKSRTYGGFRFHRNHPRHFTVPKLLRWLQSRRFIFDNDT